MKGYNFCLKGPIPSLKKLSKYQEANCDNLETWILLLKLWNSICNRLVQDSEIVRWSSVFRNIACVYNQEKMFPFHLCS